MSKERDILISVCVPAYKRVDFLKRLLNSLAIQSAENFEVVVSDDSGDNTVEMCCKEYGTAFPLRYFKNSFPLGTPENWNEAIKYASGNWIKIMHDDDWFANEHSLRDYTNAIKAAPTAEFLFSAYENCFLDLDKKKKMFAGSFRLKQMQNEPATLISRNIIGAPSVTIYKKNINIYFDRRIKWLVDIDFYIRVAAITNIFYIDKILVNIGLGREQVTQDCFRQRTVEIPENFYLLTKIGNLKLKNLLVYDAWWRLIRNLEITDVNDIFQSGYSGIIPPPIVNMIYRQKKIGPSILKAGVFSKLFMFASFRKDRNILNHL